MQSSSLINRQFLTPLEGINYVFNMGKRFAISFCLQGDIDIEIMNQKFHIESNSIMICLPFSNIKVVSIRQPSEIIFINIDQDTAIGLSELQTSIIRNNLLLVRQHPVVLTSPDEIQCTKTDVEKYLSEINEEIPDMTDDPCAQLFHSMIEARGQLIISQFLKIYFTHTPKQYLSHNEHDIFFQHFMTDLYNNYMEHHDVKYYAQRSGLSLKYFSTIIRKLSGASPSEWIESIIANETYNMLRNPHNNIKGIAIALNFPDAASFSRYISRVTGMTPRSLRNRL